MSEIPTSIMSYDEFEEKYVPIKNHLNVNAPFNGCMFETFGEELIHVLAESRTKVWTVFDDPATLLISGYHITNSLGYIITEQPLEQDYMEVYDAEYIDNIGDEIYWGDE